MTQLILNIENTSIVPHLKKVLKALDGVSISKPMRKRKTGLEEAYDDVHAGRINHYKNAEALYKALGI